MKVNPTGSPSYIANSYRTGKSEAGKQSGGPQNTDEATLSDTAITFSKVFAQVRQAADSGRSEPELERIAQIKQQVQAGTYRCDSEKVAESILRGLFG